jgi:hypothetical protein
MKYIVVMSPRVCEGLVKILMPPTPLRAYSAEHVYSIYEQDSPQDLMFEDTTGDALVESRTFDSAEEAKSFVAQHARGRQMLRELPAWARPQ